MATEREIENIKAGPWGWRYKFDRLTGVCLSVEARSLVDRYPLYKSILHSHADSLLVSDMSKLESCKACWTERRRGERWRAYLWRELGGK